MPLDKMDYVLRELAENKVFSTVITGGEPLVYKRGLFHALEKLPEYSIDPLVNTNLSRSLDESELERLSTAHFVLVSFPSYRESNFDGIVRTPGAYKRVVNNLTHAARKGIKLGINQVVTQENKEEVYETGKFVYENFGIKAFSTSPMVATRLENIPYELSKPEIIEVALELKRLEEDFGVRGDMLECVPQGLFPPSLRNHRMTKHLCSAGHDFISISVSGDVNSCPKMSKVEGNIFSESLKDIWAKIQRQKNSFLKETCPVREDFHRGIDPLASEIRQSPAPNIERLELDRRYLASPVRSRPEGDSLLIFGRETGMIFGNESLEKFINALNKGPFSPREVISRFGPKSEILLNILYQGGIVRDEI